VLMHAQGTDVAHVGDSRAYLCHEGQIFRLTRDHSIVQELVDRGLLTPQRAAHHPEANRITRALGMALDVQAELRPQPVHHVPGDAFVLCTDGLCDLVEDHEILGIVAAGPAAQAAGRLVDLANARGGHDNITVIVLRAREAASGPVIPIAPTVAQTGATQAPAIASTSTPTVVQDPPAAAPHQRPLEPTPPPSTRVASLGRRPATGLIASLVLAGVGVALLSGFLFTEFAERRGKRNATTEPVALVLPAADASADGPTTLAPEGVVLPPASPPGEPIVPLEPSPSTIPRRHRP